MIEGKQYILLRKRIKLLVEHIRNLKLKAGDKLPSEPAISDDIGWSRMSLRESMAVLEWCGAIQRSQGKATVLLVGSRNLKSFIGV